MVVSKAFITLPILIGFTLSTTALAENPIFQTYYSPDPAPVVFGDTVCVYTGNDEGGSFFTMHGWRVSCSTDMVNWTDRGELILSHQDFNGNAKPNGDWAAQVVRRNGKYYYYVTVESSYGGRAVNVAVADKPEGPFKDALNGKHLAGPNWAYIDPTVWVDDDGQAYIYWGNPKLYYAKLNDDMISLNGAIQVIDMSHGFAPNGEESKYTEGPWIHKRNNKYYMLYASHGVPEKLSYSVSDSPTGPWTWGGVIMDQGNGTAFTNHPGLIEFKGRSFLFYHNQKNVSGGGYSRSTAVEEFTWNADGSIPFIKSTDNGVIKPIHYLDPFKRVEAETKSWVGGITVDKTDGYTIIRHVATESGNVYLTNMNSNFYTKVRSVDMGDGADRIIISTRGNGGKIELHSESETGPLLATLNIPASSKWTETSYDLTNAAGIADLFFVVKQSGFDFDYWYMESDKAAIPQAPYKGEIATLPGVIEAENYDEGGHNKAFFDNDLENQGNAYRQDEVDIVSIDDAICGTKPCNGYAIGYTQEDEWLEYSINVLAHAKYDITANIATAFATSALQLFIDDKPITESITVEQVDSTWNVYKEIKIGEATISEGEHILKVLIKGAYLNIDWIQFSDPNNAIGVSKLTLPQKTNLTYNVFDSMGKFLGNVKPLGKNISHSLKQAGFASGMYIIRGIGHTKAKHIQVK